MRQVERSHFKLHHQSPATHLLQTGQVAGFGGPYGSLKRGNAVPGGAKGVLRVPCKAHAVGRCAAPFRASPGRSAL